jgi:hypothetical protein
MGPTGSACNDFAGIDCTNGGAGVNGGNGEDALAAAAWPRVESDPRWPRFTAGCGNGALYRISIGPNAGTGMLASSTMLQYGSRP